MRRPIISKNARCANERFSFSLMPPGRNSPDASPGVLNASAAKIPPRSRILAVSRTRSGGKSANFELPVAIDCNSPTNLPRASGENRRMAPMIRVEKIAAHFHSFRSRIQDCRFRLHFPRLEMGSSVPGTRRMSVDRLPLGTGAVLLHT